jgi:hypothetical protein
MSFMNSTTSPAGQMSNESKSQAISIADDDNDGNCGRTEKRLLWTKKEDLRLVCYFFLLVLFMSCTNSMPVIIFW